MNTFSDQDNYELDGQPDNIFATGGAARSMVHRTGLTSILSLFLLLLAFFIMLNSIAQFETRRTDAVLGSLAATFNVEKPEGQSRTLGSFVGHLDAVAELEREITGLLRTLVQLDRFEVIRSGTLVSATIDNDVLFGDGVGPTETMRKFTRQTAGLLNVAADRLTIEMTAYARPAGGRVLRARSASVETAAARAGSLVRAFAEFGVATSQLVVALEDGDPDETRIEFRVLSAPPLPELGEAP